MGDRDFVETDALGGRYAEDAAGDAPDVVCAARVADACFSTYVTLADDQARQHLEGGPRLHRAGSHDDASHFGSGVTHDVSSHSWNDGHFAVGHDLKKHSRCC